MISDGDTEITDVIDSVIVDGTIGKGNIAILYVFIFEQEQLKDCSAFGTQFILLLTNAISQPYQIQYSVL